MSQAVVLKPGFWAHSAWQSRGAVARHRWSILGTASTCRAVAHRLGDRQSSAGSRGHAAAKAVGTICRHDWKYKCGGYGSEEDQDRRTKMGRTHVARSNGWKKSSSYQVLCKAAGDSGGREGRRGATEKYIVERRSLRQDDKDSPAKRLDTMDEALNAVASLDEQLNGGAQGSQVEDSVGDANSRSGDGLVLSWMLFAVLLFAVLLADWHVWSLIQRPHALLFLTTPFLLSALATAILGGFSVPLLTRLKASQIIREEGPKGHYVKSGTPTMGGLFLIPVGVGIARMSTHFTTPEVNAVCLTTLAFAFVGLLDDSLILIRKNNKGLPGCIKLLLQVLLGVGFMIWRVDARLQTPYLAKMTVQLPWGLYDIHQWFYPLAVFCFAAMSNGVNLTDGLDGLAAGTAAAAFVGMAIACLPVYPALGVFGVAMAGACIGFLAHNHHKAKVFMGDTGSLALGGALAAMAGCTGQFYPLFICSGIFVIESISVILQVMYFKTTKKLFGEGRRLLRMSPFHHHLELSGLSEPRIIQWAYLAGIAFALLGAWAGIASA